MTRGRIAKCRVQSFNKTSRFLQSHGFTPLTYSQKESSTSFLSCDARGSTGGRDQKATLLNIMRDKGY
jgi:hypothetical protein